MADNVESKSEKKSNGCEDCDGHHHSDSVVSLKEKKKKGLKKNVSGEEDAGASIQSAEDFRRAMELLALTQPQGSVKTTEDAMTKQYEFWNTQPVPKIGLS